MFDRDSFVTYVGPASGTSYAAGLSNIESLYGADIDAEYQKDGCKALLQKLNELKLKQPEGTSEMGNLRNRISNLKRYIQFKDSGGGERMKIVEQIRAAMKDIPLGTKLKRQEIIDRVVAKFHSNPTSIIPSDYCYNMTNKGKTGTVNFFMNTGTGEYEYVGENYAGMGIPDVVSLCKKDFDRIWADEKYKWIAAKHYKDTWDIDAPDFASMLTDAFSQTYNLLAGGMYYAYKMICEFARLDPETVRGMFQTLYSEDIPLEVRYKEFRAGCDRCLEKYKAGRPETEQSKVLNHYQDLRAVSVYLSFEFPDTYFLYKYKMYTQFKDLIGFQEEKGKGKSEIWKLENFNRLCDAVLKVVESDSDLLQKQAALQSADPRCCDDSAHHLLTQTIIYVGSYTKPKQLSVQREDEPEEDMALPQPEEVSVTDVSKNTILYGPPGTGKTYYAAVYAVAIIENKPLSVVCAENYDAVFERYNEYKDEGLVEFTTFHQSYGYEEFIEGIRPTMNADDDDRQDVSYEISSGIFKSFCERAAQPVLAADEDYGFNADPVIWKVSLDGTGENKVRTDCMEKGHIRLGWDEYGERITSETDFSKAGGQQILNAFLNKMRIGDIVLSCFSATSIDAIGVVTGEYEWHNEYERLKRLRKVRWLVKGIQEDITQINNGNSMTLSTVYRLSISLSDVVELIRKYAAPTMRSDAPKTNHVFIIDEINRGNISKVFGELITLIEPAKRLGRPEGITARLPYSNKPFGVPDNVYLLGTMNTADRSIATIDTALRRRFQFKEMQPDPEVLVGISVEDISIKDMLTRMNERIRVLYDREHTIGHAYFIPLKQNPTIETLAAIFEHSIMPLLQEYFFDDYEKIRLVLGDNNKQDEANQFIISRSIDYADLFGATDTDYDTGYHYEINRAAFDNIEAYRSI